MDCFLIVYFLWTYANHPAYNSASLPDIIQSSEHTMGEVIDMPDSNNKTSGSQKKKSAHNVPQNKKKKQP